MKKFMNKKLAMSLLGYAIVLVIVLAIVMTASAPFLLNNFENNSEKDRKRIEPERELEQPMINLTEEIRRIERQLSDRVDNLERRQQTVSDKYVCTIEGKLDDNGVVVPVNTQSDNLKKFVFVCEYFK